MFFTRRLRHNLRLGAQTWAKRPPIGRDNAAERLSKRSRGTFAEPLGGVVAAGGAAKVGTCLALLRSASQRQDPAGPQK